MKNLISFLLLAFLALFTFALPEHRCFLQLHDNLLLLNLGLEHELLPFLVELCLPILSGFLLHSILFLF